MYVRQHEISLQGIAVEVKKQQQNPFQPHGAAKMSDHKQGHHHNTGGIALQVSAGHGEQDATLMPNTLGGMSPSVKVCRDTFDIHLHQTDHHKGC